MPEPAWIKVMVVYAEPSRVFSVALKLAEGATVNDAIDASHIRARRPEVAIDPARVGIFARRVTLDTKLSDGDRVEIYRPLKVDPKEARRRRARISINR
ncbi:MAG TPA: RnfH family protein [Rhodanobacteraceae bacterium]